MHNFAETPLAIVGMACRLPGADDLEGFWKLLESGRSGLGELPADRFDRELHYHPKKGVRTKSYTSLGGVTSERPFDPTRYPLPPELIERSHDVHLTLYGVAVDACRHAGFDLATLRGQNAGVYIGHTPPSGEIGKMVFARQVAHTAQFLREVPGFDAVTAGRQDEVIAEVIEAFHREFPPGHPALTMCANAYHAPSLISDGLGLRGPSMAFDAACASSMRALGTAAHALQRGQIDMAIVGSASFCNAATLILFSQAQSVSPSGSCPFDESADGLVAADGFVVLCIKRLDKALADGDAIQAVIRGIGVSSDGKGKSLWAPRQEGQILAIQRAYGRQARAADLQYVEMHATSTQVGDATELGALKQALSEYIPPGTKLPIGSVKANVGHTLESAGLASMVKAVLAMQHGIIPPQINVSRLNKKVDWNALPFYVPTTAQPWPRPHPEGTRSSPRHAAVNAFGIGGLNVHVALEEYLPETARSLIAPAGDLAPGEYTGGATAEYTGGATAEYTGGATAEYTGGATAEYTGGGRTAVESDAEAIAVIGSGAIFPGARTIDALWDVLQSGERRICEVPPDRWDGNIGYSPAESSQWHIPSRLGGFITDFQYDWKKHKVPPKQVASADPLQFMLLDAADQALHSAGYREKEFDRTRTGVIVGTIFGAEFGDTLQMGLRLPEFRQTLTEILRSRGVGEEQIQAVADSYEDVLLKHMPALIDETGSFTASTLASRITKTFDLMGGAVAVDAGDASAMAALSCCIDALRAGDCDMMLCAAGHRSMSFATFDSLDKTGFLAHSQPRGPFEEEANGCVPGEGVGVLVLKRLADARRDGDNVQAVIRGIGAARDDSLQEAIVTAIERAFRSSGLKPDDVCVIETAVKGLRSPDRQEVNAITAAYGTPTRDSAIRLGAVAGQFGNTGGVSGVASLLKASLELNRTQMPPNVPTKQPSRELAAHGELLSLPTQPAALSTSQPEGRLFAGVTSYSQKNLAYHVLVEGMTRVPARAGQAAKSAAHVRKPAGALRGPSVASAAASVADRSAWRIVRIAAGSLVELVERAQRSASDAAELYRAAADPVPNPASSPFPSGAEDAPASARFRLSLVVNGPDDLAAKCALAAKQIPQAAARPALAERGIFFGEVGALRPRIAFLFPGQGSQYTGMLESLVRQFPPAAAAMSDVDDVLAEVQLPSFGELAWRDGDELGKDVWRTQLSLLAADTIMFASTTALGIEPQRIGGHSFGELVALVAAGSWSFYDAVRATSARCRAIDAGCGAPCIMLSTSAPASVVEPLCSEADGPVYISHRNAPDQTVVGGDPTAVEQIERAIVAQGFQAKVLAVPAAFHTPLMEAVKAPFREGLRGIVIEPPRIPLISSVTNRFVADPQEILENLVTQMITPVDYVGFVERLAADGTNLFVEVGPKQVLTALHRRILKDRPVIAIGSNHPKRDGLQQLLAVRAQVEVTGALDPPDETDRRMVRFRTKSDGTGLLESGSASDSPAPLPAASGQAAAQRAADCEPLARSYCSRLSSPQSGTPVPTSAPEPLPAGPLPGYDDLNVLRLCGTPFEMGCQQGRALASEIRAVLRRHADLAGTKWDRMSGLDDAVARPDAYFGPEELEELRGIAKGADVTFESVVAHNLRLYLDAGAGGIHFAVTAEQNPAAGLLHASNEDLRRGLSLRDCLVRNIQARYPADGIPHISFGVAGQVGTLNGINARGLAISTAMLLDVPECPRAATRGLEGGLLRTVLAKRVLERAGDVDAAIALLRSSPGKEAWCVCLSRYADDRVSYVEYDGNTLRVQASPPSIFAANHRVMHSLAEKQIPLHSQRRLNRLKDLLGADRPDGITVERAQHALRDLFDPTRHTDASYPTMNTVRRVDNQISIVMQPSGGNLWVTAGPSANGTNGEFRHLRVDELLSGGPSREERRGEEGRGESISAPHNRGLTPPARQFSAGLSVPSLVDEASLREAYDRAAAVEDDRVCRRYVMRAIEKPPAEPNAEAPLTLNGPVLIVGRNSAADALRLRLESSGADVRQLASSNDADAALGELETLMAGAPAVHLFLMTPFDDEAAIEFDWGAWRNRRAAGVLAPYLICQRWYQLIAEAKLIERSSLFAATALGGDFGFGGGVASVEGGALAGLVKGVKLELEMTGGQERFHAKVVDFASSTPPEAIAESLCREFAAGDEEVEVGYADGGAEGSLIRVVPRPLVAPVTDLRIVDSQLGGVFVVTGGARGVTAVVARELGQRFGAKLHLIGSSPLPAGAETYRGFTAEELKEVKASVMKEALAGGEKPIDAWGRFEKALEIDQTLHSLAEAGIQATYHSCDVSNYEALAGLLEKIRGADGPITGVIHGAGFERACRFEKKQRELVDRTISAKVDGAFALMELTQQDPIQFFAAFGSVSGRFGGVGQTDYCTANETLSKLVDWYRRERAQSHGSQPVGFAATAIHWHAWDDVGMAVRPESQHIRKLHNIRFMPSQEGVGHLIEELRAGLPEGEIVVTELGYYKQKYLADAPAAGSVKLRPNGPQTASRWLAATALDSLPLIDAVSEIVPGQRLVAEMRLDPVGDVFLTQHRYKGKPMLPVVIAMESLAEAAQALCGEGRQVTGLRDIEIVNGLRFHSDEPQNVRLTAAAEDGLVKCELTADVVNRRGQLLTKDRPYLRAVVELGEKPNAFTATAPSQEQEWHNCWYPEEDIVIYHGPPFRCLRQMAAVDEDAYARMVAPPLAELAGSRGDAGWILPPALLDSCFFASGIFLWVHAKGAVAIPNGIRACRLGRHPHAGEKCLVHIRYCGREEQLGLFDFVVFGEDGGVILEVDGYQNVIVAKEPLDVA